MNRPQPTTTTTTLGAATAVAALAVWNPLINRVIPGGWYVPANLAVAGGLAALARAAGATAGDLGLDPRSARHGLRLGGLAAGAVAAGIGLGLALPATRWLFADDRYADLTAAGLAYQAVVRIPWGTVVLEEVAFRGVLLSLFRRLTATRRAVAASSVLFGLWHILPTLDAASANDVAAGTVARAGLVLGGVGVTAAVGALFCGLRLRSGSLLAPVVVHVASNSLGVTAAFVALRAR